MLRRKKNLKGGNMVPCNVVKSKLSGTGSVRKKIILTFVGFYLPGYKSGGPLRTIMNMVSSLSDEFEFLIVTRDHDIGEENVYPDIVCNEWLDVQGAKLYYLPERDASVSFFKGLLSRTDYDILYLNSFFDVDFSIKPLLANALLNTAAKRPVVLAPRGEFSPGALSLKSLKKKIYLHVSKSLRIYKGVTFQASSEFEANYIKDIMSYVEPPVKIAIDLPGKGTCEHLAAEPHKLVTESVLRVVFLSRISPMKNLDFALKMLHNSTVDIVFDIYGPIEDVAYWEVCSALIETLPKNIKVNYCGPVAPDDVSSTFSKYDLFFFPTRGENYGHVIAESLCAGTTVLISDQTPWKGLARDGLGWDIPLDSHAEMTDAIADLASRTPASRFQHRKLVQSKIAERLANPESIQANRDLFNNLA
ncbi:glycosyltransferase [Pseudomonas sp. GG8]